MKANELMVRDWISYIIPAFDDKEQTKSYKQLEEIKKGYSYLPIPLTEDILEVNGFDGRFLWIEDKNNTDTDYVEMEYTEEKDMFFFIRRRFIDGQFRGVIKYVHELQHALRLCGLNEIADNFKIKIDDITDMDEISIAEISKRAKVCADNFNYAQYESNFVQRGYIKGAIEQETITKKKMIDKALKLYEEVLWTIFKNGNYNMTEDEFRIAVIVPEIEKFHKAMKED